MRESGEVADLVREAVSDYDDRSIQGGLPVLGNREAAVKAVLDTVAGFGPLQQYFDDPLVEEIWINSPCRVANCIFQEPSPPALGRAAELSASQAGRDLRRQL